ncbi:MAG TPA: hypothetical protein VEU51_13250 [Candidatus Acidoferrales bacterium]|nr:hypothetical protein [Candidatus Acidoferrales bacterium]
MNQQAAAPATAPDLPRARPVSPASSLFRYSPALILVAVAIADLSRFADPDLWGHVRFGQAVLSAGHIVWTDPYSYTAPGHRWLNHEWLSEVIMGALYNHLNVFGLKLMKVACAGAVIFFMAAAEAETGAPTLIQFAILITSAVTIGPQMQFRPQAFSFALLSALLYMLTRDNYGRGARLWIAVPMMILWANLHGGFILGLATLGIYTAVSGIQDLVARRGVARVRRLAAIAAASTLATLLTPYGVGTWQAVLHALLNPYTRSVVMDWQPIATNFQSVWQTSQLSAAYLEVAVALMAALAMSFILTPAAGDLPMVAIAAVMSAAALISVRNLPVAVIAIAAPLARHLPLALKHRWPAVFANHAGVAPSSRLNQAILVLVAILVFWRGDLFSNNLSTIDPYPVAACRFIKQHNLRGNVLSMFSWGEYLIWHLPDSKVFIDGRYDTVYPRQVLEDFFVFNYNQKGGERALTKYPTDLILIRPNLAARPSLDASADWRLIYSDELSVLYARADSPAARMPGVPFNGAAQIVMFP